MTKGYKSAGPSVGSGMRGSCWDIVEGHGHSTCEYGVEMMYA